MKPPLVRIIKENMFKNSHARQLVDKSGNGKNYPKDCIILPIRITNLSYIKNGKAIKESAENMLEIKIVERKRNSSKIPKKRVQNKLSYKCHK